MERLVERGVEGKNENGGKRGGGWKERGGEKKTG